MTCEPGGLQELLDRLKNVSGGDGQWTARCPNHKDDRNSLSIGIGREGRVLLKCHAGCETQEIVEQLGIEMRALMPGDNHPVSATRSTSQSHSFFPTHEHAIASYWRRHGPETIQYHYTDAKGELVGVTVRWDTPDGKVILPVSLRDSGWVTQGMPSLRPLYQLPNVLGFDEVFVVEGEKAADALYDVHLVATTSAHGANAAHQTDWTPLAGKTVILWADNDSSGESYVEAVASILGELQPRPRILRVTDPDAAPGDDAADLVDREGERAHDVIREMVENAVPAETPQRRKKRSLQVIGADEIEPEQVQWLWEGWIPRGYLTLIVGETEAGKGFVVTSLVAAVSKGGELPDGQRCGKPGNVLVLCHEDAPGTMLLPRLIAAGGDRSRVKYLDVVREEGENGSFDEPIDITRHLDLLREAIEEYQPDLLVIDPIDDAFYRTDGNKGGEVRKALIPFLRMLSEYPDLAVVAIKHPNKNDRNTNHLSRIAGSTQWVNCCRAMHWVMIDPDDPDRRLLLPGKVQVQKKPPGLAFEIVDSEFDPSTGVAQWKKGRITETPSEVLFRKANGRPPRAWERAADWLVEELSATEHGREKPHVLVEKAAGKFSKQLLKKAVEQDPRLHKDGGGSLWFWCLR